MQIPTFVRSEFKIEPGQVLKVGINSLDVGKGWLFFYARILDDGRITIPKLIASLLQGDKTSLSGYIFEVTLEPCSNS